LAIRLNSLKTFTNEWLNAQDEPRSDGVLTIEGFIGKNIKINFKTECYFNISPLRFIRKEIKRRKYRTRYSSHINNI
jgi:hypothetical protein